MIKNIMLWCGGKNITKITLGVPIMIILVKNNYKWYIKI